MLKEQRDNLSFRQAFSNIRQNHQAFGSCLITVNNWAYIALEHHHTSLQIQVLPLGLNSLMIFWQKQFTHQIVFHMFTGQNIHTWKTSQYIYKDIEASLLIFMSIKIFFKKAKVGSLINSLRQKVYCCDNLVINKIIISATF